MGIRPTATLEWAWNLYNCSYKWVSRSPLGSWSWYWSSIPYRQYLVWERHIFAQSLTCIFRRNRLSWALMLLLIIMWAKPGWILAFFGVFFHSIFDPWCPTSWRWMVTNLLLAACSALKVEGRQDVNSILVVQVSFRHHLHARSNIVRVSEWSEQSIWRLCLKRLLCHMAYEGKVVRF